MDDAQTQKIECPKCASPMKKDGIQGKMNRQVYRCKNPDCDHRTVRPVINGKRAEGPTDAVNGRSERIERNFGERDGVVTTWGPEIRTLEDALKAADVDLETWEVHRHEINSWQVSMRLKQFDDSKETQMGYARTSDEPIKTTNFQVKVWLRRKVKLPVQVAVEGLIAKLEKHGPKAIQAPPRKAQKDVEPILQEISLFDHHLGLLAREIETGNTYNLQRAKDLYVTAVAQLLDMTDPFHIDKIVLPIGQDFFHINDSLNATPRNKNPLDVDGCLAQVFEAGFEAVLTALNYCLDKAPVDVVFVPGNHDPQTAYFLCHTVKSFFRATKHIKVDLSPRPRKYVHYGVNLLGYTHGLDEKHDSLPIIMATECQDVWGKTTQHEWRVGHYHRLKETKYNAGDTHGDVRVRVLPSLSGIDKWHWNKGYVKTRRVAETSMWGKQSGYIGHFSANWAM